MSADRTIPLLRGFMALAAAVAIGACGNPQAPIEATPLPESLSLPLEQPVTLRIGVVAGNPALQVESNPALDWLAARTGIHLRFETIEGGNAMVRQVTLGEMVRAGTLPDLFEESLLGGDRRTMADLFVNLAGHPGLLPRARALAATDPLYRDGLLGRVGADGRLYSLGLYRQQRAPYSGALAYRQDLFQEFGLTATTWEELYGALRELQRRFPKSYPFGAFRDQLLYAAPSWFGSGLDWRWSAYFHPEQREWRFGPYEQSFEDFVFFFARLYREGLLHPSGIQLPQETWRGDLLTGLTQDGIFVTPWPERTGLGVPGSSGALTEAGEWDGSGRWFAALPLPRGRGGSGWVEPRPWSGFSDGWLVNKRSPHAPAAVALLDFLLDEEVALVMQVGVLPRDRSVLAHQARSLLDRRPLSPVRSREVDLYKAVPLPEGPDRQYFLNHDVATYLGHGAVVTAPWPSLQNAAATDAAQLGMVLQTRLAGEVLRFIIGARPLSEFQSFVSTLSQEADQLLELLRTQAVPASIPALLQ